MFVYVLSLYNITDRYVGKLKYHCFYRFLKSAVMFIPKNGLSTLFLFLSVIRLSTGVVTHTLSIH